MKNKIIKEVTNYYTKKIKEFGSSPKGVDWNSNYSQEHRFAQLCKVINNNQGSFSILDYGCGYGQLYNYLNQFFESYDYYGYDISNEMIKKAKVYLNDKIGSFHFSTEKPAEPKDYVIASGIFNVKLNQSAERGYEYRSHIIEKINEYNTKGFSFNMLTKYSDKNYIKDYLHYADPLFWFDYCKQNFSRNVALLHDYDLYEFTIIVRK